MSGGVPTQEARLVIPMAMCEAFEAWVWEQGALAVTLAATHEGGIPMQILFPETERQPLDEKMKTWLRDQACFIPEIEWTDVDHTLWQSLRRQRFERQIIGNLCLIPEEEDPAPLWEQGKGVIRIHANHAFGTGDHATTRMMVAVLQTFSLTKASVLDVGCGTGILSIVAELLGARACWGFDNDRDCFPDMQRHLALNGSSNTQLWIGDVSSVDTQQPFDVILANVTLNVHVLMQPHLNQWSHQETRILGSGVEEAQWEETQATYAACGWGVKVVAKDSGWLCFEGRSK